MLDLVIENIATATQQNNHWAAARCIAAYYGATAEKDILAEYEGAKELRGYSEGYEITVRTAVVSAMLNRMPEDLANKVRAAL